MTGTGDRGSGTVLAVSLMAVLVTLLVAGLLVAAVAVAGQRARTAADLAALAGAGAALDGAAEARVCEVARQVVVRNGAEAVQCRTGSAAAGSAAAGSAAEAVRGVLPSTVVEVVVSREVAGTGWVVTARARAGGVLPEG
jgi:secretion/DNA translocation related TadE-like protein